ncbi:MAG: alkaline phosphatase family protein [Deltaproteobacteria bacterium]|nr:alkaline phosphatase family protein [Deltaproteobacteria bacterium]
MAEAHAQMYDWYARALLYLIANYEWELLYVHVHALDYANHIYQNAILEEHNPNYQKHIDNLYRYYKISDDLVGEMLKVMDEDTLLFVVSDHGGMSREAGCETPLVGDPHSVAGKVMEDLGYMVVDRKKEPPEIIWEKTRAISQRSGYIYINLKGREPHGSVEPEEYNALVEKIIDDLLCMRDPGNGRRPIALALRKEDMPMLGLYGNHVGDIYFTFNSSWTRVHGTQLTTSVYKGTSVGCLFMAAGPGIKKGEIIKRPVNVIDIVPTICHLTDIPLPRDVEGGIIYQALEGF